MNWHQLKGKPGTERAKGKPRIAPAEADVEKDEVVSAVLPRPPEDWEDIVDGKLKVVNPELKARRELEAKANTMTRLELYQWISGLESSMKALEGRLGIVESKTAKLPLSK